MKKVKKGALKWIAINSKPVYINLILNILLGVVASVLGVWLALKSKNVIDVAIGSEKGSFKTHSIVLFSILALQLVVMLLSSWIKTQLTAKLTMKLRQNVFLKLLRKDWQSISAHHSGELLSRINSDVNVVVNGVSNILPNFFSLTAKLVSAFVALFLLDNAFATMAIAIGPPIVIAASIYSRKMKTLHKKTQETEGKSSAFMQESLQNMLMIKSFESEEFISDKALGLQKAAYKLKMKRNLISIIATALLFLIFTSAYYAAVAWGAFRLARGVITVGTMTALLQLISQIQTPFMNLSALMPQFYASLASAERIIELENIPEEPDKNSAQTVKDFDSVDAEGLTFSYNTGEPVLENAEFEIKKNEFIAITGESGAGKSTLIKLMLGLVSPSGGEISVRSGDTKLLADKNTRKLFSYVPQGNMILSGTIRDNIRFSKKDVTDEKIKKCAQLADILDFIDGLEKGLDTVIGERGLGLSEGQAQRLAIARALIYDTPILLLDEATSALDSEAERKVLENIKNMTDKTCIIITHKRAALEFCDKNYHLVNGKIIHIK